MLYLDSNAIREFDTEKHIYLTVKNDRGRTYLVAEKISWFGRFLMYLGWSNASMSKVIDYIAQNESFKQLSEDLYQKLYSKIVKYEITHGYVGQHNAVGSYIQKNQPKVKNDRVQPPTVVKAAPIVKLEQSKPTPQPKPEAKVTFTPTSSLLATSTPTSVDTPATPIISAPRPMTFYIPKSKVLGNYIVQDFSALDHTIVFNNRAWKCSGMVDISDWNVNDEVVLKEDDRRDKGFFLVVNKRISDSVYFSPCGAAKPTISGSTQAIAKTKWKGTLDRVEGNYIYVFGRAPIYVRSYFLTEWEKNDFVHLIEDGEDRYLKNITRNDKVRI